MNMRTDIVDRALSYIGDDPITNEDIYAETLRFGIIKDMYLQTFLETLSEIAWTGGRTRDRLMKTHLPHLPNEYRFTYDMPYDCAKPIELQQNGYFVVEDRFICTDTDDAQLLYVSNGKIMREVTILSGCGPGELPDMEYLSGGWPQTCADVVFTAGGPEDQVEEPLSYDAGRDDYPDYRPPEYEPKFYQYVEKMLAAKMAIKIRDKPELYSVMLQSAMLIKGEAINASASSSAARRKSARWWAEELGIRLC